jgi:hypothetical protein
MNFHERDFCITVGGSFKIIRHSMLVRVSVNIRPVLKYEDIAYNVRMKVWDV